MTIQRAAKRLRNLSPVALLLAALLLASGSLAAQGERSRPSDSSAGSRTAEPRSSDRSSPPPSSTHSSPPPSSPSAGDSGDSRPSGGGRHAVPAPRDREPNRQRPRDRGGRDGDRDFGGGYWHHGSYYDPYFYPYGYWGRFGWWWGGWWWGDSYYPHYPYDHYGRRYGRYGRYGERDALGALDLDVAPGKTEVYLDGRYVGIVDQYDGFPQYLWLDKGIYDVVFFRQGYKTLARQISIYPGTVISVDDRMEPGESVRPEDLVSKSTERRDHRIREDATRREEYERRQRGDYGEDDDWRDRGRRRGRVDERDRDEDREEATEEDRSESGWLRLEVEPEDASVYLDGRFVGTGRELAGLRRGLAVEPGDHHISVVRPGRQPEERDFEVEAGEETELEIELETGGER
ncbi:MAG TPA: PEGA domain-containing protein [Thermoanaerobaculia bacterium]